MTTYNKSIETLRTKNNVNVVLSVAGDAGFVFGRLAKLGLVAEKSSEFTFVTKYAGWVSQGTTIYDYGKKSLLEKKN